MPGGSKTTTTAANNTPWAEAQPLLKKGLGEAGALFDAGIGGQVYTSPMFTPFAGQSIQGMNQTEGVANDFAAGARKPFETFTGMMDYWNPIAKGDFAANPAFMSQLKSAQDAASDAVNLSMSGAGRYGSAVHTDALAKAVGDVTNKAMLDFQGMANNQLMGYGGALPGAFQTALQPSQALMGVGANYENLAANMQQDQRRIFDEMQNNPWDLLAKMNAIGSGAGQLGSSQTQKVTQPGTNWLQTGLGYGLQALGGGWF